MVPFIHQDPWVIQQYLDNRGEVESAGSVQGGVKRMVIEISVRLFTSRSGSVESSVVTWERSPSGGGMPEGLSWIHVQEEEKKERTEEKRRKKKEEEANKKKDERRSKRMEEGRRKVKRKPIRPPSAQVWRLHQDEFKVE